MCELDYELISTCTELVNTIKTIEDLYPDLERFNVIRRLVTIANKWDKLFVVATKEGGI